MTNAIIQKRTELEEAAMETASGRGHRMTPFAALYEQRHIAESICEKCEAYVQVNAKAKTNEIETGGTATILDCVTDNAPQQKSATSDLEWNDAIREAQAREAKQS